MHVTHENSKIYNLYEYGNLLSISYYKCITVWCIIDGQIWQPLAIRQNCNFQNFLYQLFLLQFVKIFT